MRKYWIFVVLFWLAAINAYSYRIAKPQTFSLPWTKSQINQLNETLEDIWHLQQGEYNLDIVTTTKTNADNGDIWFIQTGSVVRIQYKGNNHIFTVTPDGF